MRGQYIRNIDRQLISKEGAFFWLLKGDLKAETESESTRPSNTNKILINEDTEHRDR
jgi:hypothetical protein